jgi:hypothetical protein
MVPCSIQKLLHLGREWSITKKLEGTQESNQLFMLRRIVLLSSMTLEMSNTSVGHYN